MASIVEASMVTEQDSVRVVMAGPLPPAVGGMATVIGDISQSYLADEVGLVLFDTNKKTAVDRKLWEGIAARLRLWREWWRILGQRPGNEIAHVHTCSGLSYFLDGSLVLLAKLRRVPVILHVHGAKFDEFLDSLSFVGRAIAGWLARRAERVVVLSDEWQEKLSWRLPKSRLVVIVNGVPIPPPTERSYDDEGEVTILFLGNLGKRKGVWDLLLAAERLPKTAHVMLVGGEEDPGVALKVNAELDAKKLSPRVKYIGPAYGDEKHQWLGSADIFVLPSYAEGLPISMLEAMAAGLPVVVTPVGGIPTVIQDGENGLLVDPGNVDALAAALKRLAGDGGLRRQLGTAARTCCAEKFGIDSVAKEYLKLYQDILAD